MAWACGLDWLDVVHMCGVHILIIQQIHTPSTHTSRIQADCLKRSFFLLHSLYYPYIHYINYILVFLVIHVSLLSNPGWLCLSILDGSVFLASVMLLCISLFFTHGFWIHQIFLTGCRNAIGQIRLVIGLLGKSICNVLDWLI